VNSKLLFSFFIAGLVMSGCSTSSQPTPTPQTQALVATIPASATPTRQIPSATPSPTETPTPLPPTSTPSPSPSLAPTDKPTATLTPIAWGVLPLDSGNAASMVQRAAWGLGVPQENSYAVESNVFIQRTPFGIYLYKADDLQFLRFLADTDQFLLSPNGDLLFARLADGSIQVVNLPTGEDRFTFQPIAVLSPWMKDYIYSKLPNERPALEKEFFGQVSAMKALAINPDNTIAAIGFGDASVGLWNLQDGELLRNLKNVIVKSVLGLVFSPDGNKLLSTGSDGEIAVWRVQDGQLLWRIPKAGHIIGQPFSMDGSLMAIEITQGASSWVAVRETEFGEKTGVQVVGSVASQAISPDNTRLVTTWYEKVEIWSLPNLIWQAKIDTGLAWPSASFSPDGTYILMNNGEQAYFANDLSRDDTYAPPAQEAVPEVNTRALQLMGHLSEVIGLRYPAPEQAFAWGKASEHEAWVLDVAQNIQTIYDFGSPFIADPNLSFSGDRLAACTEAGLVVISLVNDESSNFGPCREPTQVLFSPDGKTIFRASVYNIDALNSSNGELLYNLVGHSYPIEGMAITANGKYLLSSSVCKRGQGREMFWWQVDEPKQVLRWIESVFPYDYLYAADFDPDENVLYAALGGLRSWRLGDGQPDHLDTQEISSLALSTDNHLLATGDFDGLIHIWSVESWQELAVLSNHKMRIQGLAFSPDGSSLLSIAMDGTIRLWGLP
jgi:WD40 repeat protein